MTTENATQPGAFESASSARSQALAQIAKGVHEANAEDFNSFDENTGEIGAKLTPPPAAPQTVETTTERPEQTEQTAQTQTTEQQPAQELTDDGMETIVVFGQQHKVKREQLLEAGRRTLQKESAAEKQLEEAKRIRAEAEAYARGLMQRQPSSDAGTTQEPASSDPANGTGATQGLPYATPQVRAWLKQELWIDRAEEAAQRFAKEFPDIASDPDLARLVSMRENDRLEQAALEGKPLGDPWDAYKSHGEYVRTKYGKQPSPGSQVQVSDTKAERKRDVQVVTGSTTTRPQPAAPKPLTTAEQIEKMRQQRAQGSRQLQPTR